jgi:hypothetical protein
MTSSQRPKSAEGVILENELGVSITPYIYVSFTGSFPDDERHYDQ